MGILDDVRGLMRARHMAIRTERAYVGWIERFLRYERDRTGVWRHPSKMGSEQVNRFLTFLAVERKVAASTQTQALSALLLLFRDVLKVEKLSIDAIRAKHPNRLPVVLNVTEVWNVMREVPFGVNRLQHTCLNPARTSVRFKNCWGTRMSVQR